MALIILKEFSYSRRDDLVIFLSLCFYVVVTAAPTASRKIKTSSKGLPSSRHTSYINIQIHALLLCRIRTEEAMIFFFERRNNTSSKRCWNGDMHDSTVTNHLAKTQFSPLPSFFFVQKTTEIIIIE